MWKCKKCDEEQQDNFEVCWRCGRTPDGSVPENFEAFQTMKKEADKVNYTSTCATSRTIAILVSFVGWIVVGIGILIFIASLTKESSNDGRFDLKGLLLFQEVVISGLVLVMTGQLTRATIDTADNTCQMLSIMRGRKGK